uniref:Uncharacterized protein n=1 Tax=Tanacetum cinerariifolium TaxID=118510 RepID=A0A6L2LK39_TANCI|nr:hypothetical protein [Tanacetum cinerariifolium]
MEPALLRSRRIERSVREGIGLDALRSRGLNRHCSLATPLRTVMFDWVYTHSLTYAVPPAHHSPRPFALLTDRERDGKVAKSNGGSLPLTMATAVKREPSELAQMATKGNLGEVVTTCERSWVQASPWGFSFMSEKRVGFIP